jgi:hypothetical protein
MKLKEIANKLMETGEIGLADFKALKLKDLEKLTEEIKHWCLYSGDKSEKLGKNLSDN